MMAKKREPGFPTVLVTIVIRVPEMKKHLHTYTHTLTCTYTHVHLRTHVHRAHTHIHRETRKQKSVIFLSMNHLLIYPDFQIRQWCGGWNPSNMGAG